MYKINNLGNINNGDKMNVKDIMTKKIITKDITSSINDIAKTMQENDIGLIPITEEKKVVGLITDRDLVIKALCNNEQDNKNIKDFMTTNIITIDLDDDVNYCLEKMAENKVKRLIVTDSKKVAGIISLSDIMYAYSDEDKIIKTIKQIFSIDKNEEEQNAEIDEFYL